MQLQSVTDRALLSLYRHKDAHRNKGKQKKYSKDVLTRYSVVQPVEERVDASRKKGWCPVVQDWVMLGKLKAANREDLVGKTAHLVPHKMGLDTAGIIFGAEGEDVIWSLSNALWLHPRIEKALDDSQIIIIPTSPRKSSKEFKLRVIDQTLLEESKRKFGDALQYDWTELDGRTLKFRNDKRPSRRFLFFHYLMVVEDTMRTCAEKDVDSKMEALFEPGSVWATPGSYRARGILDKLSKRIVEERQQQQPQQQQQQRQQQRQQQQYQPPSTMPVKLAWDKRVITLPERGADSLSDCTDGLPSYYSKGW
jgi:hypothetical protein